ncbi:hypothetical protein FGO68_gene17463 [Halteria grandinella]|uniref:SAM-dependent MTase RsmB/NOP-type domain-containing protein n=1 Tax=Halteria grandinella TaxID=5974 RepID=A0A8J8T7Q9_HALGN|nr:hypothetical protein FGO68_gene17463 [Halteria grandinella]
MERATVGVGIGGDSDDERELTQLAEKSGQSKSIQISAGQFDEDDTEYVLGKLREAGTDYDPPTRYDGESQMSEGTLSLMEREMGVGGTGGGIADLLKSLPETNIQLNTGPKKQQVAVQGGAGEAPPKPKKKVKKVFDKKVDKETKEKRLRAWEEGGNRLAPVQEEGAAAVSHDLVVEKHNQDFVNYYQGMEIVPKAEWENFYGALKENLDICFRINSVEKNWQKTKEEIENQIQEMLKNDLTKDKIPRLLKWYPSQLAYTFHELSRSEMKANPLLKNFHTFLVQETENGRIFRQEAVSMIPVTLLHIEPHHKCLDMCAAPGSKTIQILEYLHQNGIKIPEGFVIANDTDSKRAYMLTHQARRLNSPAMLITNNDARRLPNLRADETGLTMKFDRILCDVPCSGDGTLRKNPSLWKNFNAHLGHATHPLQREILERGIRLLKKGGRLVYSTCTFNPLEDEAVVADILSKHIKQVELVDVSSELSPHLKYRPGRTHWKVYHRGKGQREPSAWYTRYEDVPNWKKKVIKETMFNSTYTHINNEPERVSDEDRYDPLNLKRCMRIFPHDDNQGGFFVAVFTKVLDEHEGFRYDEMYEGNAWDDPSIRQKPILQDLKEFALEYEKDLSKYEEQKGIPKEQSTQNEVLSLVLEAEEEARQRKKASGVNFGKMSAEMELQKEEQFTYAKLIDKRMDVWMNLQLFYGINSSFPSEYLFYQKDTTNNLVFISDGMANGLMKCTRKYKLKVVNIGVKMFSKNRDDKSEAKYRLLQEGLELLLPYMDNSRKITVAKEVFLKFLEVPLITYEDLKSKYQCSEFEGKEHGSAVMFCAGPSGVYATVWMGVNNVSLMVNKEEIKSFKFLIQ